ncbi:beta-glucosidase [Paenibacillus sp. CCS19]|uniref:GH1 family beta-glucosidase n=1 Tax=Paenibacillus sp. CCS19 TaxID=3158387 RepID=UPI002565C266|nr:GH1 family beta-glucosidase [Paenibacillus cellulosilyticus]GMK42051.1 beta-glucosidase [Paenibacillus cellulosilyticus]
MAIVQFPEGFKWGAATASYQVEGAYQEGGRGLSIWDTFARTPGKVFMGDNGDVACDMYHKYPEDVKMMADMGIQTYRFSIAWPRIIPDGSGEVNQEGLEFYHRLVDELLKYGIEPMCTLYHWDLPQALQDRGGWDNRETIDHFVRYSETVFESLKGKIKLWATFNEPWCVSFLSNYLGDHAPGNRDLQLATNVSHHLLVAHGRTVRKFREMGIVGQIGIVPNMEWREPYSTRQEDIDACERQAGWLNEWFIRPVMHGHYPEMLVEWFRGKGVEVPIQPGDMEDISQKIDFLGVNYYTGTVGRYKANEGLFDWEEVDMGWDRTDIGWTYYPQGLYNALMFLKNNFGDIPIYITENGACYNDEPSADGKVHDDRRIRYIKSHLASVSRAIESGVNVKGYYAWSLMDNYEWAFGYSMRFGMTYVDYDTQERIPKDSFKFYSKVAALNWFTV